MEFAARILGTGSAYPEKRLTNDDIARKIAEFGIETSDQWIRDRTGIRERRVADKENGAETNSSLGAEAARKALSMAGKTADEIDQIIYATFTPDTIIPSTACWLQQQLGHVDTFETTSTTAAAELARTDSSVAAIGSEPRSSVC